MTIVTGVIKRCFKCRSRGDLGSCKDQFGYNNASALEKVHGVEAIPCASGWCGKVLEGGANTFKDEGKSYTYCSNSWLLQHRMILVQ